MNEIKFCNSDPEPISITIDNAIFNEIEFWRKRFLIKEICIEQIEKEDMCKEFEEYFLSIPSKNMMKDGPIIAYGKVLTHYYLDKLNSLVREINE